MILGARVGEIVERKTELVVMIKSRGERLILSKAELSSKQ